MPQYNCPPFATLLPEILSGLKSEIPGVECHVEPCPNVSSAPYNLSVGQLGDVIYIVPDVMPALDACRTIQASKLIVTTDSFHVVSDLKPAQVLRISAEIAEFGVLQNALCDLFEEKLGANWEMLCVESSSPSEGTSKSSIRLLRASRSADNKGYANSTSASAKKPNKINVLLAPISRRIVSGTMRQSKSPCPTNGLTVEDKGKKKKIVKKILKQPPSLTSASSNSTLSSINNDAISSTIKENDASSINGVSQKVNGVGKNAKSSGATTSNGISTSSIVGKMTAMFNGGRKTSHGDTPAKSVAAEGVVDIANGISDTAAKVNGTSAVGKLATNGLMNGAVNDDAHLANGYLAQKEATAQKDSITQKQEYSETKTENNKTNNKVDIKIVNKVDNKIDNNKIGNNKIGNNETNNKTDNNKTENNETDNKKTDNNKSNHSLLLNGHLSSMAAVKEEMLPSMSTDPNTTDSPSEATRNNDTSSSSITINVPSTSIIVAQDDVKNFDLKTNGTYSATTTTGANVLPGDDSSFRSTPIPTVADALTSSIDSDASTIKATVNGVNCDDENNVMNLEEEKFSFCPLHTAGTAELVNSEERRSNGEMKPSTLPNTLASTNFGATQAPLKFMASSSISNCEPTTTPSTENLKENETKETFEKFNLSSRTAEIMKSYSMKSDKIGKTADENTDGVLSPAPKSSSTSSRVEDAIKRKSRSTRSLPPIPATSVANIMPRLGSLGFGRSRHRRILSPISSGGSANSLTEEDEDEDLMRMDEDEDETLLLSTATAPNGTTNSHQWSSRRASNEDDEDSEMLGDLSLRDDFSFSTNTSELFAKKFVRPNSLQTSAISCGSTSTLKAFPQTSAARLESRLPAKSGFQLKTKNSSSEDSSPTNEMVRGMMNQMPVVALQQVLAYFSCNELCELRRVHPHWDELCGQMLNSAYYQLIHMADRLLTDCQRRIHSEKYLAKPIQVLTNLQVHVINPVDVLRAAIDEGVVCFPYGLILDKAFELLDRVEFVIRQKEEVDDALLNWERLAEFARRAQVHYRQIMEPEAERRMAEVYKLSAAQRLQRLDSFLVEASVTKLEKHTEKTKDDMRWEIEQLKIQNQQLKKDNRELKQTCLKMDGRIEALERKFKTMARLLQ